MKPLVRVGALVVSFVARQCWGGKPTVGVYDENIIEPNAVDLLADGSVPLNVFANIIAEAYAMDFGGVASVSICALPSGSLPPRVNHTLLVGRPRFLGNSMAVTDKEKLGELVAAVHSAMAALRKAFEAASTLPRRSGSPLLDCVEATHTTIALAMT